MPKLDGAAVLHLKKSGGYSFLPVKADESLFRAFLYCREVFRFQEELSRSVVGSELKPPPRPVAATVVPKGVGEP